MKKFIALIVVVVTAAATLVLSSPASALTNTFTGSVDSAGTLRRTHYIEVKDLTGPIDATLDWTNSSANLSLLLYSPSNVLVRSAASKTAKPEVISYQPDVVGKWKLVVKAVSGSTTYTLTANHSPATAPPAPTPLTYSSAYGYKGSAGEYTYGMDFDTTDNTILVGDVWNYRVKRYTTSGEFLGIVSRGADRGQLGGTGAPFDVEADPDGDVWSADQSNSRIVEFDHNGNWKQTIGAGGGPEAHKNYPIGCGDGKMYIPTHMVVHPETKDLYVADVRCRNVYVFTHDGHFRFQFTFELQPFGVFTPIPRGIGYHNGLIYVVEHNSRRIVVFDATNGEQVGVSARQEDMNDPRGLEIDAANGWIYVVAAYRNEAFRFSFSGNTVTYSTKWDSWGTTRFDSVRWPAVDDDGNVYIGDTWAHTVRKFDRNLNPLPWATPPQPPPDGGWNQVNGIGIDHRPGPNHGRLYGVDHFGNRAQRFATAGTYCHSKNDCPAFELAFGGREAVGQNSQGFTNPTALTFGDGYVWADGGHAVIRFDENGNFVSRFGSHGKNPGQFGNGPLGIRVVSDEDETTADGLVYTTDGTMCRIQVFRYDGTLVDNMGSCGSATGQMMAPRQLDVRGNLVYVADTGNSRVVVWDTDTNTVVGTISTTLFAGKRMAQPRGILLDPSGTWLYIGDTVGRRVLRIRVGANGVTFSDPQVASGGADIPEGAFKGPEWMEFGPDGRLFVSDNNQRIYAFAVSG